VYVCMQDVKKTRTW